MNGRDRKARQQGSLALSRLLGYVWNIDKGLRKWNAAKAKAATSTPNIVFLGDSITDSTGATSHDSGFVALIRNALQLSTGLAGHGFVNNQVFIPDGTWTALQEGTNLKTWMATPSSTMASFKDYVKTVDVIYAKKPDGGTATIKADGITLGTINCNGTSNSWHNVATFTVSAGVHTIQVVPATSGNTYIEGFICYTGANGVIVNQVGHPGIKAADYVNTADIIASTSAFNPFLTVIMLGTNDSYSSGVQVPVATYKSRLDSIVKQALTTGDVLIMSMADRSDSASLTIPYSSYVDAAKEVAVANNTAYLSLYERWNKSYAWANGYGYMSDSVHPSQIGHSDIAEAIRTVLGIAFPVSGVFQINYDVSIPYGDIKMANVPGNFRISDVLQTGLHAKGKDIAVTSGASSITISNAQPDSSYVVKVTPNWNTTYWVTGKVYSGFTVNFGTAAPSGATIDWEITR